MGGAGEAERRGAARGRGGRRAPGGAAPSFGSGRARGAPRGFSGRQKSGKPTEREHKGGSQTAGGAPTTCRPAPAGGGRRREPRREGAVPWPGAALPSAARPAPRRAASRAALRGWESRAARRPRLPSASPAPSPLCLRPRVRSASFLAAERCHVFSHLAYRK